MPYRSDRRPSRRAAPCKWKAGEAEQERLRDRRSDSSKIFAVCEKTFPVFSGFALGHGALLEGIEYHHAGLLEIVRVPGHNRQTVNERGGRDQAVFDREHPSGPA